MIHRKNKFKEIFFVSIALFIIAIGSSYPLILHLNNGIPHTSNIEIKNNPGDHLQTYYWFWLLKDNLIGESDLFTNPYEFNMHDGQVPQGINMFPFSILFVLLSPFGDVAAYNCLVLLSYILAGLFTYLLCKLITRNIAASFISAIIFMLVPFRISQVNAGHLNGFILFYFPLILYLFELAIQNYRKSTAFLCGAAIFTLALMEPHMTYYLFSFLLVYVPIKFLILSTNNETSATDNQKWDVKKAIYQMATLLASSFVIIIFWQLIFSHRWETSIFNKSLLLALIWYPPVFLCFSLFLAYLFSYIGLYRLDVSLQNETKSNLPFILLLLYALPFIRLIPGIEYALIILAVCLSMILKIFYFNKFTKIPPGHIVKSLFSSLRGHYFLVIFIATAIGMSVIYLLNVKYTFIDDSIVGEGRGISELALFSPKFRDILNRTNVYGVERIIYLGLIPWITFTYVYILLVRRFTIEPMRQQTPNYVMFSFFATAFLLAYTLSIGLGFGHMSLYLFFYHFYPFFDYPRVPIRILPLALISISILSAVALTDLRKRLNTLLWLCISITMGIGLLVDYTPFLKTSISLMSNNPIYQKIKNNMEDTYLLELPLWPGDSHQSSLYEYFTTKDRIKRINGYSPVVTKKYIEEIFWPLSPLNTGDMTRKIYNQLKRIPVKYITLHDNDHLFARKASRYDPMYTVRKLLVSPYLTLVLKKDNIYLFELKDKVDEAAEEPHPKYLSWHFPAGKKYHNTGTRVFDESIGKEVIRGSKLKDPIGFLNFGPYDVNFNKGRYLAYFRMKTNVIETNPLVTTIDVVYTQNDKVTVVAEQEIYGKMFDEPGEYKDFYLPFSIDQPQRLEFRAEFHKNADIWIDKIVVHYADEIDPLMTLEAEHIDGNIGIVISDDRFSGKKAISARISENKSDYLISGPFRKYPAGNYVASFYISVDENFYTSVDENIDGTKQKELKNKVLAEIDIVRDNSNGRRIASKTVRIDELKSQDYHPIPIAFSLDGESEIGYRLFYYPLTNLNIDKIEIEKYVSNCNINLSSASTHIKNTQNFVNSIVMKAVKLNHATGQRVFDPEIKAEVFEGRKRTNNEGFLTFGPYIDLPAGSYRASFQIKVEKAFDSNDHGRIEVMELAANGLVLPIISKTIKDEDLPNEDEYNDIDLYFTLQESTKNIEFRTFFNGKNTLRISNIRLDTLRRIFEAENIIRSNSHIQKKRDKYASNYSLVAIPEGQYGPATFITKKKVNAGKYEIILKVKYNNSKKLAQSFSNAEKLTLYIKNDQKQLIEKVEFDNFSRMNNGYCPFATQIDLERNSNLIFEIIPLNNGDIWLDRFELTPIL